MKTSAPIPAKVVTIPLYTFDQLSDKAKRKARDWWRGCADSDDLAHVIEDAVEVAKLLGIEIHSNHRLNQPLIYWQLSYSQGDFASYVGTWHVAMPRNDEGQTYTSYAEAVKAYAPKDETLHAVAKQFDDMRRQVVAAIASLKLDNPNAETDVTWCIRAGKGNVILFDQDDYDFEIDISLSDCTKCAEAFANWIYKQLKTEDEHQNSDEYVDDAIQANGYLFTAEGEFHK